MEGLQWKRKAREAGHGQESVGLFAGSYLVDYPGEDHPPCGDTGHNQRHDDSREGHELFESRTLSEGLSPNHKHKCVYHELTKSSNHG